MKPQFYTLVPVSILLLTVWTKAPAQFKSGTPPANSLSQQQVQKLVASRKSTGELPQGVSADWYSAAVNQIQQMESAFYPEAPKGSYRVANANNRLGFSIHQAGYQVYNVRQSNEEALWKVNFQVLGAGRQSIHWKPGKKFNVDNSQDMLRYIYPSIEIQYTNGKDGLRQNFIVKERPTGKTPLTIQIRLTGDLKPRLLYGRKLVFNAPGETGKAQLLYEDLKVWDNHYSPLKSSMKLNKGVLTIEVDDRNAAYPITIDPVNRTPDWNTETSGLLTGLGATSGQILTSLYGFTVAGLGDVNGDNFGDVAIGAPGLINIFNGNTTASAGAVFVYYGSDTGLSKIPNKTLQPNTLVAGALFGTSIDAGDVTGDGINDIVIGAPMDTYQTSASALLGTVNVNVQAGKVYVYPGGSLAAPNPSNFTDLKLTGTDFFSNGVAGLLLSNVGIKGLFGFSVAVTDDLNNDGKKDIVVGAPAYMGVSLGSVQAGAAFVMLSDNTNSFTTIQKLDPPTFNLLGLSIPLVSGINGLLFGFSVDGAGDYNGDGKPDVVVGAPAGVDLSSLTGIITGQVLGGSALVYFGKSDNSGVNTSFGARLQASSTGLLGNAANLFGFKVKGVKNANGTRNGNIVVGAPLGGLLANALSLSIKTGNIHLFKKKTGAITNPVSSDQRIESPRDNSVLQLLSGTLQLNLLFGTSIDNAYDVNGDNFPDLVVGEPLSSGANLLGLQANAVGGSAYVYLGDGAGGYLSAPTFNVSSTYGGEFLSVNATALLGFSVAGAPGIRGPGTPARVIVGSPLGALDYGAGLLNLGSTLGTTLNFAAGGNGLGKAYSFDAMATPLPVTLVEFKGAEKNKAADLSWSVREESNIHTYEVQRSSDGTHFENIAMVLPWDNHQVSNDYRYTDKKAQEGINFYRLNMVDQDGSHKYSAVIIVRIGTTVNGQILIAPNPVKDRIRVVLSGLANGSYRIELRNTSGQLQQTRSVSISQRDQVEYLDRSASPMAGIYWLTVYDRNNQKIGTSRVIVQ